MKFTEINPFVRYCAHTRFSREFAQDISYRIYDRMIIYFFDGTADIEVDNVSYNMSRGSIIIMTPDNVFKFLSSDKDPDIAVINFDYSDKFIEDNTFRIYHCPSDEFNSDYVLNEDKFEDEYSFNTTIYMQDVRFLEETILDMSRRYRDHEKYYEINLKGRMMSMIVNICHNFELVEFSDVKSDIGDRIVRYIDENYFLNLSNKEIGEMFSFNPLYLSKLVKERTGYPLHEYIVMRRISRAMELLETSDMLVLEIALVAGFSDIPHFSRSFKKYIGISPDEYRRRIQSKLGKGNK